MKLSSKVVLLLMVIFCLFIGEAWAGYSFTIDNLTPMSTNKYNKWGIDWPVSENETITSVTLIILGIRDTTHGPNSLLAYSLDSANQGLKDGYEKRNKHFAGNYFLNEWVNESPNPSEIPEKKILTYDFSEDDLGLLMKYTNSGENFGLGFNPNCRFKNDGFRLEITTMHTETQEPAPEPATMILFGIGILGFTGLKRFRRQAQISR